MHFENELQESVSGDGGRDHHGGHNDSVADIPELPIICCKRIGGKSREVNGKDRAADGYDERILKSYEQILISVPEDFPVA